MATSCHPLSRIHVKGWQPLIAKKESLTISESFKYPTWTKPRDYHRVSVCSSIRCFLGITDSPNIELSPPEAALLRHPSYTLDVVKSIKLNIVATSENLSDTIQGLLLADLDPATAKLAIGILGPFLSAFAFLFILRIVMSWYPKLPVERFPYIIAYAPTEPFLIATRKLIPPLGGVDVTPVVWFGLISFLNEILVGPQGLLVLVSQQVS